MLVGSLKYIISCPLIVAHRLNIICGDSAAIILREETGIRLRRRFARSSPVVNPAALAPQGSTLLGASGVPMAHCKLQGNRGSKLRWHTFSRCWVQTNTTAQAACGSTRGMDRAGIGVFSEVTGACRELKIHHFLPFDCSPPSQYNLWGLCSYYFA